MVKPMLWVLPWAEEPSEGLLPALPGDGLSRGDRARAPPGARQSLQLGMDSFAPTLSQSKSPAPESQERTKGQKWSTELQS